MKNTKKRFASIAITLAILGILITSGPASAITLNIDRTDGSSNPYENSEISFKAKIDLHENDFIPLKKIEILVDSTPDDDDITNAEVCSFDLDGDADESNDEDLCDIDITNISFEATESGAGYGWARGYAWNDSDSSSEPELANWSLEYGTGYNETSGYGYSDFTASMKSTAEIIVEFDWTTPSVNENEDYKIAIAVKAGNTEEIKFVSQDSVEVTVRNRGSSSGGSSTTIITTTNKKIDHPVSISSSDAPNVQQIIFNLKQQVQNVKVDVKEVPSGNIVISAGNKVFKYLKIDLDPTALNMMNYAKIKFKVSKQWLMENGLTRADIVLKRLSGNVWNELDTSFLSETATDYEFEAMTPGFSYFAIGTKAKADVPQPIVKEDVVITKNPEVTVQEPCIKQKTFATDPANGNCVEFATACDVPKGWQTVSKCAEAFKDTRVIEPPMKSGLTGREVSIILLVLIVIVLVSWLVYRGKNPGNPIRRKRKYHYYRP